jgi:hypothetical protein
MLDVSELLCEHQGLTCEGLIMHHGHELIRQHLHRRTFLVAGGLGFAGLNVPNLLARNPSNRGGRQKPAKSTILLWLSGGASHIDCWDLKPDAPVEYRGEFKAAATSAPGVRLCEHLPRLAKHAHQLAVVNSLGHYGRGTNDHHAGYYYNLTGHEPDPTFRQLLNARKPYSTDWPFMGSVVAYKRPPHPYLPSLITVPEKTGAPEYTRPGQLAARLGLAYDPVYVQGKFDKPLDFVIPELTLHGDVTRDRLLSRKDLLHTVDDAVRTFEQTAGMGGFNKQQERAFSLLASPHLKAAFDITQEPLSVREKYGQSLNGMSVLMARRLVEAGVPFVTVFSKEDPKLDALCKSGGSWDTHGNNFNCLREHLLPEFDRYFSALLDDLHDRGLLDETLILVNSEMGRTPKIGDVRSGGVKGAGRDHWTHCQSVLLAGGGVRGGQTYGTSDRIAAYPKDKAVAPEDIAKTVYHAMGIDDLEAVDREGRPFNLMPEGAPIRELF